MTISSFRDGYRFLSNFYPASTVFNGVRYPTSEHAYQAAKATSPEDFRWVAEAPNAAEAKSRGRLIRCRPDWASVRDEVMRQVLAAKFAAPGLHAQLLATGDEELVEGNPWHDHHFGYCTKCQVGDNVLGKLLMELRAQLRGRP